jgi:CBS domain-containing protein
MDSTNINNPLQNSEAVFRIAAFQYHETLQNVMERDVYQCRPGDSVQSVAEEMARRRISSVVVTDDRNKPVGIVTERDMVRKVVADYKCQIVERTISEIMTPDLVCLPPDGTLFDALSILSRDMIKHLPIVENYKVVGIITLRHIMKIRHAEPFVLIGQLEKAESVEDFRDVKKELIYLVREKLDTNTDPVDIVTMLSLINAGIHRRLLRKAVEEQGTPPPVEFCFFVTGSHGRKENLLFPDQDFCIITDDYPDSQFKEIDNYFYEVSRKFSDYLNEAGFTYCPGNIMGQNPEMRRRISDWLTFVSGKVRTQGSFVVRYMTLIFDSAYLFGMRSLFDTYMNHAYNEISQNYNILRQMHDEEEGKHKVPLGLFHTFITEKDEAHKGQIDMKKSGLIFISEAARVLALKNGILETSTLDRIQALVEKGVIHRDDSEYFENAYRVILYHTLKAQVDNYLTKGTDDYYLAPYELSHMSQEMLKEAFKAISKLQDIVASEFGELIL